MSGSVDTARAQELALLGLLNQIWGDPEVGDKVRLRAKALHPEIQIPDDHPVARQVRGELAETRAQVSTLQKLLDEQNAARAAEKNEASLRTALGKAQEHFKLTDEGLQGTIKLMQDRQIIDPMAGAALYVDGLPKPKPTGGSSLLPSTNFNLYGTQKQDETWRQFNEDPDGAFRDVCEQVFIEMPVGA